METKASSALCFSSAQQLIDCFELYDKDSLLGRERKKALVDYVLLLNEFHEHFLLKKGLFKEGDISTRDFMEIEAHANRFSWDFLNQICTWSVDV
jgi:hypothetical protein